MTKRFWMSRLAFAGLGRAVWGSRGSSSTLSRFMVTRRHLPHGLKIIIIKLWGLREARLLIKIVICLKWVMSMGRMSGRRFSCSLLVRFLGNRNNQPSWIVILRRHITFKSSFKIPTKILRRTSTPDFCLRLSTQSSRKWRMTGRRWIIWVRVLEIPPVSSRVQCCNPQAKSTRNFRFLRLSSPVTPLKGQGRKIRDSAVPQFHLAIKVTMWDHLRRLRRERVTSMTGT